ncbi:hypothetical protein GCM10010862_16330 [Devosia nitrariae]|uniref:EF-hand domain-containing protein n=2 Tax=Devosia nitrariae TaxID=2071872 RepID=A0ABQ5W3I4_9HYPH|nr:hypothetical protein GCM10010862_16330 [Devosia nitrariae]
MLSLAAVGLAAGAVYAQEQTSFASLDTDANGELSFEEITVAWPQLTQEEFSAADLDVSGGLSGDEVATMQGAAATPAPEEAPTDPAAPPTTAPEDVAPPVDEVPSESL